MPVQDSPSETRQNGALWGILSMWGKNSRNMEKNNKYISMWDKNIRHIEKNNETHIFYVTFANTCTCKH